MFPILFKIGPITLHTYGFLIAIGFTVGIALAVYFGKKENISKEKILDIGFYSLVSAIVGSRLFYVLIEYKYFSRNPIEIFKIWEGGLVFYGGVIVTIPVLLFYFKRHNMQTWKTLDLFAPSFSISHAIGRLGCFSAGCCYGKPVELPWSVTFTDPNSLAITGISLHPTQLYEFTAEIIIFTFLMLFRKHKSFDGQLILIYMLFYSISRFIVEFFRGDPRGFIYNGFSIAQGISVLLFGVAVFLLIYRKRKIG